MKIHYFADTDSLYIELLPGPGTDVMNISEDIQIDIDAKGHAVGIDIDHASLYYDVTNLETIGIASVRMADMQPATH